MYYVLFHAECHAICALQICGGGEFLQVMCLMTNTISLFHRIFKMMNGRGSCRKDSFTVWAAIGWCKKSSHTSDIVFCCFMYSELFVGGE